MRYHAGLSDAERARNQEEFIHDRAPVMVATNAFGMGIDKFNVRYVLHYNMPQNLDAYYQEAGRAGRDGLPSDCLLFYGARRSHREILHLAEPGGYARRGEQKAARDDRLLPHLRRLRAFILNYFGEHDAPEKCTACGNCTENTERAEITTEALKILSCVYRMSEASGGKHYGISMLVDVLRGSQRAEVLAPGFDKISTYGLLRERSARDVREMTDFLIAEGYLQVGGEFPTLSFTARTMPFFKKTRRRSSCASAKATKRRPSA